MAQALYTIDEYIATVRKKPTIWIVFNTIYNNVHAFKKRDEEELLEKYLKEEFTDKVAQKEFLDFMKTNFPDTEILQVFDLVSDSYLIYPYLGSYAINTDIGSDVYNALSEKYGDPYKDATVNNKVLWVMEYEDAIMFHKNRIKAINEEFGEDE